MTEKFSLSNPFYEIAMSYQQKGDSAGAFSNSHSAAMARHFPLGPGYGRGSQKSRDKAIDRSITAASKAVEFYKKANFYFEQARRWERGEIDDKGNKKLTDEQKEKARIAKQNFDKFVLLRGQFFKSILVVGTDIQWTVTANIYELKRINKNGVTVLTHSSMPGNETMTLKWDEIMPIQNGKVLTISEMYAQFQAWCVENGL